MLFGTVDEALAKPADTAQVVLKEDSQATGTAQQPKGEEGGDGAKQEAAREVPGRMSLIMGSAYSGWAPLGRRSSNAFLPHTQSVAAGADHQKGCRCCFPPDQVCLFSRVFPCPSERGILSLNNLPMDGSMMNQCAHQMFEDACRAIVELNLSGIGSSQVVP